MQLEAGQERTRFGVHKGLLTQQSAYFQAAFNGGFAEAIDGLIKLVDDDARVVAWFVTWLYSGQLLCEDVEDPKDGAIERPLDLAELLDLYQFADAKLVARLKIDATNAIISHAERDRISLWDMKRIYAELPETTPLRRVVVDWFVTKITFNEILLRDWKHLLPHALLADLAVRLAEALNSPCLVTAPWDQRCSYYSHDSEDTECPQRADME